MRINTVGTPVVTPPERSVEVTATSAVARVDARTPGAAGTPARPVPAPVGEPVPVPVQAERRQQSRRGADRRQRQVAVLIDTRVAQRRAARRRAQDGAPDNIDVEA